MYTLVLITLLSTGAVSADNLGEYVSISDCFDARDVVLVEDRAWDGFLKGGKQAVCILTPEE